MNAQEIEYRKWDGDLYAPSENSDVWCTYCGATAYEDAAFCLVCERAGLVGPHSGASLAVSRQVAYRRPHTGGLSFKRSRRCFSFQRRVRKAVITLTMTALSFLPYYYGCKFMMGDAFPANVQVAAERIAIAGEMIPEAVANDRFDQLLTLASR